MEARRIVESLARESYGRLIAYLAVKTSDVAAAEDALHDAFVAALTAWERDGVPQKPEAWLLATARHRLIDRIRHQQVQERSVATLLLISDQEDHIPDGEPFPDERLPLLFVCAHPAIDSTVHTPLMLQTVLGFDAASIARAFLVPSATMAQRLVRAKAKIRDAGIAFEVPDERELPDRLNAVLEAIYAAYGSGWEMVDGGDAENRGLADEAIWLARVLVQRLPREPEAHGLLSLMLHCEARRRARRSSRGDYVPLSEQDVTLWDLPMLRQAEAALAAAAEYRRPGRFQLEAAIQSVHAERLWTGHIDWAAAAGFYEQLLTLASTVGAQIGYAAALGEVRGADAGLAVLNHLPGKSVHGYQPYWAVRAHLLCRKREIPAALQAFDRAIALAADEAVRRFLIERRSRACD